MYIIYRDDICRVFEFCCGVAGQNTICSDFELGVKYRRRSMILKFNYSVEYKIVASPPWVVHEEL